MFEPTSSAKGAFTLREFMAWSGIRRTKALREISSGRLLAVKAGRKLLIPVPAAQAWLTGLSSEITLEN